MVLKSLQKMREYCGCMDSRFLPSEATFKAPWAVVKGLSLSRLWTWGASSAARCIPPVRCHGSAHTRKNLASPPASEAGDR